MPVGYSYRVRITWLSPVGMPSNTMVPLVEPSSSTVPGLEEPRRVSFSR